MTSLNLSYPGNHILLNEAPTVPVSSSIDVITVQARRTSAFLIQQPFQDITFDVTDFETNSSIIEHDNTNTDRITIKESGIYLVHYNVSFGPMDVDLQTGTVIGRLRINDSTVIPGSESYAGLTRVAFFGGSPHNHLSNYIAVSLSSGDYLTLQLGNIVLNDIPVTLGPIIIVTKLNGIEGAIGASNLIWEGPWNIATNYDENDTVTDSGSSYVANTANIGVQPPGAQWDTFALKGAQGFTWQGPWTSTDYVVDDLVEFQGSTYVNILDTTSAQDPTNNTYWELIASSGSVSLINQQKINYIDVYQTTSGGQNISAGYTDILMDVQRVIDTNLFTHTVNTAPITVLESGRYFVSARMTTDITAGTARSTSEMRLQIDSGSGFVTVDGTRAVMYNRDNVNGDGSCRISLIYEFTSGDIVKMQARRGQGTDTIVTRADGCSILIYKIGSYSIDTELVSRFFDDFYGSALDNIWSTSIVGTGTVTINLSAVDGIATLATSATLNDSTELLFNTNSYQFSANPVLRFRLGLSATTNIDARFGYQIDGNNSIEFRYDTSLSNWEAVTISSGSETATDTGSAADTSQHVFEFAADADNNQIIFKIDSITVATNNTNLPSGLGHIFIFVQTTLGAVTRSISLDFVEALVNRT